MSLNKTFPSFRQVGAYTIGLPRYLYQLLTLSALRFSGVIFVVLNLSDLQWFIGFKAYLKKALTCAFKYSKNIDSVYTSEYQ